MMKPVVANLTADDMTTIVAYLASIKPSNPGPAGSQ
jgi:cytochrome c553